MGNLADLLVFTPGFWVVCWFFAGLRKVCLV